MMPVVCFFIFCLIKGNLCEDWSVSLPQALEGLSGTCLKIPCRFNLASDLALNLDDSCRAIWRRGYWYPTVVFDSSLTGENAKLNILQGNLTGILREKDCTTIFHNMPSYHYGNHYFRLECDNQLKISFEESVYISVQDSPPHPTIIPFRLEVEEGTPVRLKCSAVVPCPILPPTLTWTPSVGDTNESVGTKFVTSLINFTSSYLHHKQMISCIALYNQQSGRELRSDKSLTISVLYAPQNTSVSFHGPVREGKWLTMTCNTNANPAVHSYTWYKLKGDQVSPVGYLKTFSFMVSGNDTHFYCMVSNRYGSQNSSIVELDIQFPPRETTVTVDPPGPVKEGRSVTLLCNSHANPVVTNYTWYRHGAKAEALGPSLVIDKVELSHSGDYYCEAKNDLGRDISATYGLDVQYRPKNTTATPVQFGPVLAGSPVTLICTCMANPEAKNFTWYRMFGQHKEVVGSEKYFSFYASKLSENQFYCEALNVHGSEFSQPASINVTFAPEILSTSHCIKGATEIQCSCDAHGNPPPSLHWELAGQAVNHSADVQINEVPLEKMGLRSLIIFHSQDVNILSLVCFGTNSLGADRWVYNVTTTQSTHGSQSPLVLIGSAVAALGMLLLCLLLVVLVFRKKKASPSPDKGMVDTSDCLVADEANTSQEVVYANSDVLVQEGGIKEDGLHYAVVNFTKRQAESEETLGDVRGTASNTTEYAEICLLTRAGSKSDTKAGETNAKNDAIQEEQMEEQGHPVSEEPPDQPEENRRL
ncbi:B-cell receptor CD22-like [Thalassophryne amazonica]|uniref:B-cell receptor CD22-like n=1 Tax=Thalassophryne amazonica TaxID=390379 RepID=UPI001471B629|nr:B-cell receptor CD22-like [Thalassophryne amazonica]XP_034030039.1 B-cell receptor CD22-like [Thalassophryne amazonica]XP_034030041.1 B-cell receptor CD22-like [Thalassophryne amazonica]XP_034030042.1 B-cell receptor CD22-like [Thalassophryne amazonica]